MTVAEAERDVFFAHGDLCVNRAHLDDVDQLHKTLRRRLVMLENGLQVLLVCFKDIFDIHAPKLLLSELLPWLRYEAWDDTLTQHLLSSFSIRLDNLRFEELDVGEADHDFQELESSQTVGRCIALYDF